MTFLRCDPRSITNDLQRLTEGLAPRGSSFCDIDAICHDEPTHRFLAFELKRPGEGVNAGQRRLLVDLALEERFTVWYVMFMADGQIAWADLRWPESIDVLSAAEFRARYVSWWDNSYELARLTTVERDVRIRVSAR